MRLGTLLCLVLLGGPALAQQGQVTVGAGSVFDVGDGSVDLGCSDLDVDGTYAAGSGTTSQLRDVTIAPTGMVNGEQGALQVTGSWDNTGNFTAGTGSVSFVDGCGLSSASVFGNTTFATLAFASSSGKAVSFGSGSTQTITGDLSLMGAPGTPLVLRSSEAGMAAFLDLFGTQAITAVDVEDNHATGLALLVDPGSLLGGNTTGWSLIGAVPSLTGGALLLLGCLLAGAGVRRAGGPTGSRSVR